MKVSDAVAPAFWGAAGGAVLLAIVGFGFAGWQTHGGAKMIADNAAEHAVVKAVTPYCVARFERLPDAQAKLTKLKNTADYNQNDYLTKLGVAALPNTKLRTETVDDITNACVAKLTMMDHLPVKSASSEDATKKASSGKS